jgi:uncharacterized protein with HEPN domain
VRGPEADRAALEDILSYADRVKTHAATYESLNDEVVRHAVLYELAIIGEAANHVSPEFCEQHPEVPWRRIIDFRNFILHAYKHVNLDRVWEAIDRLPELEQQVRRIIDELPELT